MTVTEEPALERIARIVLPRSGWQTLVDHARRKLECRWLEHETREQQAFGLLAGRLDHASMRTVEVFPLLRNLRQDPVRGTLVDAAVNELAMPSRTPNEQRGWLADPGEVLTVQRRCDAADLLLYGSYHMHKVPWKHDPLRDTPTTLDRVLAEHQGMWMLILSMVQPQRPRLRAFFDGRLEREAPIVVAEDEQTLAGRASPRDP
jgi:hypothetical protein